jgi:hypothetical protein
MLSFAVGVPLGLFLGLLLGGAAGSVYDAVTFTPSCGMTGLCLGILGGFVGANAVPIGAIVLFSERKVRAAIGMALVMVAFWCGLWLWYDLGTHEPRSLRTLDKHFGVRIARD